MTAAFAARRASLSALDALEGDAEFLTRTCDCRTHAQARKVQKRALDQTLFGLGDEDILSVESVLANAEEVDETAQSHDKGGDAMVD